MTVIEEHRQALADLAAEIECAECTRTRYLVHVEELAAAGAYRLKHCARPQKRQIQPRKLA